MGIVIITALAFGSLAIYYICDFAESLLTNKETEVKVDYKSTKKVAWDLEVYIMTSIIVWREETTEAMSREEQLLIRHTDKMCKSFKI